MKCSSNFEFKKRTDQNFTTQNVRHVKEYRISKKKKLLKRCQNKVLHEYSLAFAGWWWIYFGWWWVVVVDIFWLVMGGGR